VPTSLNALPKAVALERELEEEALLLGRPVETDRFDHVQMVLRNLADARIGGRDQLDHLS
jgi:hypothetical protein